MVEERDRAVARLLSRIGFSWWAVLIFGIVTLGLGIVALVYPGITIGVVGVLFGLQLLLVGLVCLILVFVGSERHRFLSALIGILAVIVGVLCLRDIAQSVMILTLAIGIYWVIHGLLLTILGLTDAVPWGAGWAVFAGILSFIAGVIILSFPVGSAHALAVILGIWLVVLGILRIVNAFQLRRALRKGI